MFLEMIRYLPFMSTKVFFLVVMERLKKSPNKHQPCGMLEGRQEIKKLISKSWLTQIKKVLSFMGYDYVEGTLCPDSWPEEQELKYIWFIKLKNFNVTQNTILFSLKM